MNILIVTNDANPEATDEAYLLTAYLTSQSIECETVTAKEVAHSSFHGFDMAVVMGGDGSTLRTAQLIGTRGIPILGMNFGHLGFLTNQCAGGVIEVMSQALAGETVTEERTSLRVDVLCEGDDEAEFEQRCLDAPDFDSDRTFFALNELAITRNAAGRIVDVDVLMNGCQVVHLRADGVVVATATGSTAYALSAGGPLIAPGFRGLMVVPIAAHTLSARAIVSGSNDICELVMGQTTACREASLQTDGLPIELEQPVLKLRIARNSEPTKLLRVKSETFYEQLRNVFFKQTLDEAQ